MSYSFYKVLHLAGIFTVILALGGIALHTANGGTRDFKNRKWIGMMHGLGLAVTLIAGFGLLARLQLMGQVPLWAYTKMGIWLVIGALPALIYRKQELAKILWLVVLALAITAGALAVLKPY